MCTDACLGRKCPCSIFRQFQSLFPIREGQTQCIHKCEYGAVQATCWGQGTLRSDCSAVGRRPLRSPSTICAIALMCVATCVLILVPTIPAIAAATAHAPWEQPCPGPFSGATHHSFWWMSTCCSSATVSTISGLISAFCSAGWVHPACNVHTCMPLDYKLCGM